MYLRICMKTKFCQLHFRGRSTLHKIGEFYLSDHGRQPQSWQSKNKKLENNKLLFYICAKPFSRTKNEGKLFLVPKSSGPLLAGLPLNGKSFFLTDVWETSNTFELYTDSAGSRGYSAIFGTHWLYGKWPPQWHHLNIATLELFPIVIALHICGPKISNKCIMLFTDNAALVNIINKQTSKDKGS